MKWFKHENTYNNPKIEMLTDKHGIVGYGVYFRILELIASAIDESNPEAWGYLPSIYTTQYLAKKLQVGEKDLLDIMQTCYSLELLESKENSVFCPKILERCDDYTQRILKQSRNKVGTKSEESPTKKKNRRRIEEDKNRTDNKEKNVQKRNTPTLTEVDISLIAEKYHVPIPFVLSKYDDLQNYCASKGKTYRDYKATLSHWVKRDALEIMQQQQERGGKVAIQT